MTRNRRHFLRGIGLGSLSGLGLLSARSIRNSSGSTTGSSELDDATVATMVALAAVIYPRTVSVEHSFVRNYVTVLGPEHRTRIQRAARELDLAARSMMSTGFSSLSVERRAAVLRNLGASSVQPRPTGTVAVRVRYYLVNGLLVALFTSPKGTTLFGIDNPPGYPGGYPGQEQIMEDH